MFTADAKPSGQVRAGLDTSTGSRGAARKAGAPRPAITSYEPTETMAESIAKANAKNKAESDYMDRARENIQSFESGAPAPLTSSGSLTVAEAAARAGTRGLAANAGVASNAYKDRVNTDLSAEQQRKAFGLGQYQGIGNTTVTATDFMARAAADEEKSRLQENIRRDQQLASAKNDQARDAAADAAQSSRYAAAVSADAQKQAAAYNMIGQLSSSSGGYKYWGQ